MGVDCVEMAGALGYQARLRPDWYALVTLSLFTTRLRLRPDCYALVTLFKRVAMGYFASI
jgi:hypothetical protein